ncbi:MAG TPA: neuraminidase-like domain-containing protein, partial [Polyangiaceae bacterium]
RLHKAALLITGLGIGDRQLEWLTRAPAYLDLDNLPTRADPNHDAVGAFRRFRQLAAFHELRKKLPSSAVDLFDVFRAETLPQAIERLALATGWQPGVIAAFLGPAGFAVKSPDQLRPAADATEEPLLLRLARAMDLERRAGVAPQTLFAWAAGTPDADSAAAIVQVVKARYDEKRWLEVARSLNDPLRIERREALVAYLLPRMRELGVTTRNRLFEYFLIDVDMSPCMLASRIQLAIAAVQTFFQRCLMNLEARVPPGLIDENDWKWLKNYRVWEANRKIFLYPENWIEPELRDDKTPLFEQLERSVLQQEIKRENVENAFADYLQGLDEIARLDVRAVWFERRKGAALEPRSPAVVRLARAAPAAEPLRSEWEHGTYHVFARTFNAPYVWYYRRLERGRAWTPWEKVDADIESEHLLPVMFHGRLHLFWTVFREVNQPTPKLDRGENKGPPPEIGKDWEIQLAYSVFDRGRWSRKRLSDRGARDVIHAIVITDSPAGRPREKHVAGSAALSPADYLLRAHLPEPGRLEIHLHRRRVASQPFAALLRAKPLLQALTPVMLENSTVDVVGMFELDGCNGALLLGGVSRDPVKRVIVQGASGQARQQLRARAGRGKRHAKAVVAAPPREPVARPFHVRSGGQLDVPSNYRVDGMGYSPPPRASGALLTLRAGSGRGLSSVLARAPHSFRGVHFVPVEDALRPSSGELAPFFFQDRFRSYFARPVYAGYRPPQLVAYPLVGRLAPAARTTGP